MGTLLKRSKSAGILGKEKRRFVKIQLNRLNPLDFCLTERPLRPECYIDASFAIHDDGRSRMGVVIMLARAMIGSW